MSLIVHATSQLDSAYVLDTDGNFVIIKPFDVAPETYTLQNDYVLVTTKVGAHNGFIAAKHLVWQQDGVRYKELTDDLWWFRSWMIESCWCCIKVSHSDGAMHEGLLEERSPMGIPNKRQKEIVLRKLDGWTFVALMELEYKLHKGLIKEPSSLTGTEAYLAGMVRRMHDRDNRRYYEVKDRAENLEKHKGEFFMDTPTTGIGDSLELFDYWPACHFGKQLFVVCCLIYSHFCITCRRGGTIVYLCSPMLTP